MILQSLCFLSFPSEFESLMFFCLLPLIIHIICLLHPRFLLSIKSIFYLDPTFPFCLFCVLWIGTVLLARSPPPPQLRSPVSSTNRVSLIHLYFYMNSTWLFLWEPLMEDRALLFVHLCSVPQFPKGMRRECGALQLEMRIPSPWNFPPHLVKLLYQAVPKSGILWSFLMEKHLMFLPT